MWSRRSTKTSPPWSRRVSTQPATVRRRPTCSDRSSPHWMSRQLTAVSVATTSARPTVSSGAPARRIAAPSARTTTSVARAGAAALRQLSLHRAAGEVHVGASPARRSSCRSAARRAGSAPSTTTKTSSGAAATTMPSFSSASSSRSMPGAEPDPGRRRTADLLDEPVVAPAAADRRVRVLVRPDELERGARVVVEPAHERRIERRTARRAGRGAPHLVEVRATLVAERVADLRRVGERRAHVPDSSRRRPAAGSSRACARASSSSSVDVRVEPRVQPLDVGRPAGGVADRVQPQLPLRHAEPPQQLVVELDHLGVDRRVGGADRLDRELPVLAVAAAAGRGRSGTSARSCTPSRAAARDAARARCRRARSARSLRGAASATGRSGRSKVYISLCTTSEASPAVRAKSSVSSKPGVWMRRQPYGAAISSIARDEAPPVGVGGQDVVRPARRLERLAVTCCSARSSRRNGFVCSSRPSVVAGPCPG